jgi:hypothetical protein
MAVDQIISTQTITTIQETAADEITIRRVPVKDPSTGKVNIIFMVSVSYSTQEYQGTSANDRTDTIRTLDSGAFVLTMDQVISLFGMPLTLPDTSVKILGDLIGDEADKLIAADILNKLKARITPLLSFVNNPDNTVTVTAVNQSDVVYEWSIVNGDVTLAPSVTNTVVVTVASKPFTIRCKAIYNKDPNIFETSQIQVI